ncbi:PREDICTED: C2 domain-containing protein 2-like [Nanorana parkeri]|uniref:C2 domain-containing protein 2-like n=1 Tax=Nanorana parkeri TaxID=125878 RepID=UPI0008547329|nr:PREDICTED: C2 domain-containing protein 2-like [Nanorana parkeri]
MDNEQPPESSVPDGVTLGFVTQLMIFALSVLTVLAWFVQMTRRSPLPPSAGARSLLTSLCRFPSTGDNWSTAWAQALNVESQRSQSSLKMQFEENFSIQRNVQISDVTCTKHCDNCMVFHCNISADAVKFPVFVTQESLAAVTCETYQVSLTIEQAQVEVKLQELVQEGLLVSWSFKDRPKILLDIKPSRSHQSTERSADLCILQDLMQNALFSAEPAMIFTLNANNGDMGICDKLLMESSSKAEPFRLIVQQLRLHNVMLLDADVQLMCEAELDNPFQRKQTRAVRLQNKGEVCSVSWSEEMTFDLTLQSKSLSLKIWQLSQSTDNVLLGYTLVALCSPSREMSRRRVYPLTPSPVLPKTTMQAISVEANLIYAALAPTERLSITPTKKVEMDRTVMPDGTLITTVTTIQSRPKFDGKMDSAVRSPTKVEVSENKPVVLPHACSSGSFPSGSDSFMYLLEGSPVKLDSVAETAIRQLTEPTNKPSKKTPTKRSTLIISGVSKVPVGEDEMALSLGYAASMDASLQSPSNIIQDSLVEASADFLSEVTLSLGRDTCDTTKSDISGWPSLDDVDSETGSIRALETRSLKDHKVGFLRSGTKLPFSRHRQNAGLSQSHDDLSDASANSHKKIGSLPRRLLKHFSLKTKSKPSVNGSAQGGDK